VFVGVEGGDDDDGANRITNLVVSLLYVVSIVVSCTGETWVYYLLGSLVEVVLLVAIAHSAWRWRVRPGARDAL
jgi:hypothetical protein